MDQYYSIVFAAIEPDEDGVKLHVFNAGFESGTDIFDLEEKEQDQYVDGVIAAILDAKGVGHLFPYVSEPTVHLCSGELCETGQDMLTTLRESDPVLVPVTPMPMIPTGQRNEA